MWPKWSVPMRNLPCHDLAHPPHVVGHQLDALVRDFEAGEHVHRWIAIREGVALGVGDRAGNIPHQIDCHIHLQEGEALLDAPLQALAKHLGIAERRHVRINANPIAELAADHLVDRHVVGLAGQVPQRHLDPADPAGLAGVVPELFDLPKDRPRQGSPQTTAV